MFWMLIGWPSINSSMTFSLVSACEPPTHILFPTTVSLLNRVARFREEHQLGKLGLRDDYNKRATDNFQ